MEGKTYRKVTEIKEWSKNPRSITKDGFERLKKQIQKLGQYKPLLITPDGEVLGGNMRLKAYKVLGIEDVWVSVVTPKDENEKLSYALSDNDRAGFYDDDLLANLIPDYPEFDWSGYSVDLKEPTNLQDLLDRFKEVEEDEVPEVSDEPAISAYGKVYQLGRHRLVCGDATKIEDVEKLMDGQKADMVFTDPPYGMDLDADYTKMGDGGKKHDEVIGDDEQFNALPLLKMFDYCNEVFLWGADYYVETMGRIYPNLGSWIIWDKYSDNDREGLLDGRFGSTFETCWSKSKHKREIARVLVTTNYTARGDETRVHPTQKPVALAEWFFKRWGKSDDVVVDLFLGSGSTLIACEQTNRICYGMELDPKYCDVIRKRYAKFIGKEEEWITETPVIDKQDKKE